MYQFKKPDNFSSHFLFDRVVLIKSRRWAEMPFSAKSIYPVIAIHRNEKGDAWPSQQTIAIMAGVDPKTVRTGLAALDDLPGFSRKSRKVNSRGHRSYTYRIRNGSTDKGRSFAFHRAIIDGGNWHLCSDSAKAVYPAMRHFSYFDIEEYAAETSTPEHKELTESDMEEFIFEGHYAQRWFEFCSADNDVLAEFAGITERSVQSALESLKQNFLIERVESIYGGEVWKVNRIPPEYWTADYMNKLTAERYRKNFPVSTAAA
jgi:hypothetical protein